MKKKEEQIEDAELYKGYEIVRMKRQFFSENIIPSGEKDEDVHNNRTDKIK